MLIGDMILGWGSVDESLSGMDQYFSRYLDVSNARIVWSAFTDNGEALVVGTNLGGLGSICTFGGLLINLKGVE